MLIRTLGEYIAAMRIELERKNIVSFFILILIRRTKFVLLS